MIRDYEYQSLSAFFAAERLMRKGDTDLTLSKYLCYDDDAALDRIFAEKERRENLDT
jgi:hypothetical protein